MPSSHVLSGPSSTRFMRRDDSPTPGLNGQGDCEAPDPANTLTDRLNYLLATGGPGYTLRLCPSSSYFITAPISFTAPNQEISTWGYPTDHTRAELVVAGSVDTINPHTTAIQGTCPDCDGVKLLNIQVNGTRNGAPPTLVGGANIEMGGDNANQLVQYVRSFDPRSWSCLHIAEGSLSCTNATVINNDIGPCGSDVFQQWADGISMACRDSVVRDNLIGGATDGGIVLFGAPGTLVENNLIWAENHTLLGGINMVDYAPYGGDYSGTIVRNNTILGGFSDEDPEHGQVKGENDEDVITKIGIAIGPRTWFGPKFGQSVNANGTVINNRFSGAFGYGIAITSAAGFTLSGNELFGNTSFIGSRGPNCTNDDTLPNPTPFAIDRNNTLDVDVQSDFQGIPDGDGLTCLVPPSGGDYWPFRGGDSGSSNTTGFDNGDGNSGAQSGGGSGGLSGGDITGLVIGILGGILGAAVLAWFIRRWALKRRGSRGMSPSDTQQYLVQNRY